MKKYDSYIGIDPGTTTGIAIWSAKEKRFISIFSGGILACMDKIAIYCVFGPTQFVIENPNLRKWYGKNSNSKLQGAGSIKRDFSIWMEWFKIHEADYIEINPKYVSTKLKASVFKKLTGYDGSTNSHSRDAAMMVFGK